MHLLHVVHAGVLTAEAGDLRPQGGEGRAGGRGVGGGDLALEGRVEQIVPGFGGLGANGVEPGLVRAEAEHPDVQGRTICNRTVAI